MLDLNPFVIVKHYKYRVETFFKDVLLVVESPLGKLSAIT